MNKKTKRSKKKSFYIFIALYLSGFLGMVIIGMLSGSFFAYEIFNSLWAAVLYLLFLSVLYVTAFASEVRASRKPFDITVNTFVFLGSWVFALLMLIFGGALAFAAELYSALMAILLSVKLALKVREQGSQYKSEDDVKPLIAVMSLLLFAIVQQMSVEFISDEYVAWSLIPAAIIFVIVAVTAAILLKDLWRAIFDTSKAKCIIQAVLAGLCVFAVSFIYSFATVGTIDYVFDDSAPTPMQVAVKDKHINSGARTITRYKIQVSIDDKDVWISVPVTDYYDIEIGDNVKLDYYKGALGFAYWIYSENSDE